MGAPFAASDTMPEIVLVVVLAAAAKRISPASLTPSASCAEIVAGKNPAAVTSIWLAPAASSIKLNRPSEALVVCLLATLISAPAMGASFDAATTWPAKIAKFGGGGELLA
jgi:hypothetical protein